jgi:hypothetical protein
LNWLYAIIDWLRDPNILTAISTLIIALFTIVLAWVGYRQARLIRKSIDLARAEFISSHRLRCHLRPKMAHSPAEYNAARCLFVHGQIVYRNDLGTTYTTSFCRIWNIAANRFKRTNDPDYEYED